MVIDSAHTLLGSETQAISQSESLAASLINERAIIDQLGGNINEAMRGSSSASTSGVSAGLGVGVNFGFIGGALGVAGGTSECFFFFFFFLKTHYLMNPTLPQFHP